MLDARDFHFATVETVLDYVHNEINCFIDHENTFAWPFTNYSSGALLLKRTSITSGSRSSILTMREVCIRDCVETWKQIMLKQT